MTTTRLLDTLVSDAMISLLGCAFLGLGILARLGVYKNWYWRPQSQLVYTFMPVGILLIGYGNRQVLLRVLGWPLCMVWTGFLIYVAFTFGKYPPVWIKPGWVQWLEAEYGEYLTDLRKDAQYSLRWLYAIKSRQGMEKWIRDIREHSQQQKIQT
ncbi:MAG: hypothetical protein H5T64_08780 [Chloroflexi bacterium]|nr:hypothetical protein [Chloroflexota bacterium]